MAVSKPYFNPRVSTSLPPSTNVLVTDMLLMESYTTPGVGDETEYANADPDGGWTGKLLSLGTTLTKIVASSVAPRRRRMGADDLGAWRIHTS